MSDSYEFVGKIRRDLQAIADLYDQTIEPARRANGSQVKASKEPPLPIGAHILDVRAEAHRDLMFWARFLLDEVRDVNDQHLQTGPASIDVPDLVAFVTTWVDWLHTERPDDADNLATESDAHAKTMLGIVFGEKVRDWMPLGDCPVTVARDGEPVACGGQVRAYNQTESSDVAWSSDPAATADKPKRIEFIRCPDCGTEDTLAWWMSQIMPEGADLAVADSVIACVTARTFRPLTHEQLRQWASRGYVRRHGKDMKGRTLYSSAAVLAYATEQEREDVA